MLRLHVIGNLGADARLQGQGDQKFVSLSIASTRRVKKENGNTEEITTWVQATINGECEALYPYLVKGQTVSIFGECSVNVYHSEKERRMMAGLRVFVRDIELVGGRPDEIPRDLYDEEGVAYKVSKYFNCPSNNHSRLYDRNGEAYDIDPNGWVSKFQVEQQDTQAESSQEPAAEPTEAESKKSENQAESSQEPAAEPTETESKKSDTQAESSQEPAAEPTEAESKKSENQAESSQEPTAEPTETESKKSENQAESSQEPTAEPTETESKKSDKTKKK